MMPVLNDKFLPYRHSKGNKINAGCGMINLEKNKTSYSNDPCRNLLNILGVREAFHPNAVMELTTLGLGLGEVRILGLESNLYLAFHSDGYLYGERDNTTDNSVFKEKIHGNYLIYLR